MSRSSYRGACPLDCKVYVGDLGNNGDRRELEEAFGRFGPLRNVWVARNPPGFAFVEFEDARDAEDAARDLDGRTLCNRRVRVELSNGRSKPKRFDRDRYDDRDRRGGRGGRDRDRGDRRGGRSRSRSRERRRSPRSRSRDREAKRERKSRSGSGERRRGRGSEEKNGGSPAAKD